MIVLACRSQIVVRYLIADEDSNRDKRLVLVESQLFEEHLRAYHHLLDVQSYARLFLLVRELIFLHIFVTILVIELL